MQCPQTFELHQPFPGEIDPEEVYLAIVHPAFSADDSCSQRLLSRVFQIFDLADPNLLLLRTKALRWKEERLRVRWWRFDNRPFFDFSWGRELGENACKNAFGLKEKVTRPDDTDQRPDRTQGSV